jgi:uncharacterized protein (UPF0261 family)
MQRIYVAGTADTKPEELLFIAARIRQCGGACTVVDVGTLASDVEVDVSASEVAEFAPDGPESVLAADSRGPAVTAMGEAFAGYLLSRDDVAGVIGIGGGGGTSIVTAGMRELPLGVPKIMVSTLASGDVSPYVDVSDIIFVPSVTDMTGLNRLSRVILHNTATAIAAMAAAPAPPLSGKPAIGLTMFGVTTTGVNAMTDRLQDDFDCMAFHATGTGGRAMENLIANDVLVGVLDITTTEICDLLFGGVLPAKPNRIDIIAETEIPYVVSAGALDMVNFWAPETVPEIHADRQFYHHNPNVTLMRTTADECREIGQWIGRKLNACNGPLRFLIPEKGISALDIEGGDFFDPEIDAALFDAITETVNWTDKRQLVRLPHHINDPEFADAATAIFREII